jgi:putative ABC transport system permease protein
MIRNYISIAFRNLLKNRSYTFINIVGLSIGITCCIIIYLLISYELNFDRFHSKADRIYRVVRASKNASGVEESGVTPYPFARAFWNDFPDVPLATQMHENEETMIRVGTEKFMVDDVLFADSLFFSVFDFKVLSGNPKTELGKPGKVFLTQSMADKLLKKDANVIIRVGNDFTR